MIGTAVPRPVPASVVEALQSVQVTSSRDRSGFQLTFVAGKNSTLLRTLLPSGYLDPMITRVIIVATVGGVPQVLMDGVITRQEISPSNEPGQSTISVTGEDLSVLMDVVEVIRPFPAMPEIAQIYAILAPYAALGIVPVAIPPVIPVVKIPTEGFDSQTTTDLNYLKTLARRCGYVFYVEPGPLPGSSIAYFGPDIRIPIPQPALTGNMDVHTNVESMSFSLDGLAKKAMIFTVFDPITKKIPIPLPLPDINILHPPLGARPTPPARVEFASNLSTLKPDEAIQRVLGLLFSASMAISGNGSLDVLRYGQVLRSRQVVGVRGAGPAYDGLYYVDSVTHRLKRGEYKQDFTLSRDGLLSTIPRIPV